MNTKFVEELAELFQRCGGDAYLGEPVTMAEHMLQAANLAEDESGDENLIVAALLHDIGHFTSELGSFSMADSQDRFHEDSGAVFLSSVFPDVVVECVRWHVAAKKYLCATEQNYFAALSEASKHSLKLQGGPMSEAETDAFRENENIGAILSVRRWDDAAKIPDKITPDFDYYIPIIEKVLTSPA